VRIGAALLPQWSMALLAVTGFGWAVAFLGFTIASWGILTRPRRPA
jgi:hypothetical protein